MNKVKSVTVYFNEEDYEHIRLEAFKRKMSLSEYIHFCVMGEVENESQ
jgi:hypothetical protein